MVLLCKANNKSIIKENLFENRFMHVAELNRMGAKILTNGNKALIDGNISFVKSFIEKFFNINNKKSNINSKSALQELVLQNGVQ